MNKETQKALEELLTPYIGHPLVRGETIIDAAERVVYRSKALSKFSAKALSIYETWPKEVPMSLELYDLLRGLIKS